MCVQKNKKHYRILPKSHKPTIEDANQNVFLVVCERTRKSDKLQYIGFIMSKRSGKIPFCSKIGF